MRKRAAGGGKPLVPEHMAEGVVTAGERAATTAAGEAAAARDPAEV